MIDVSYKECLKALEQAKSEDASEALAELLKGTGESNIFNFHQCIQISVNTKEARYRKCVEFLKQRKIAASKQLLGDDLLAGLGGEVVLSLQNENAMLKGQLEETRKQVERAEFAKADFQNVKNQLEIELEACTKQLNEAKKAAEVFVVKHPDGSEVKFAPPEERFHKQFPELVNFLSTRNAFGWPEMLYVWGAPGCGKTHLGRQLAKALKVPYYSYNCGPTVTEGKILGYNNIATGSFIKGWLYDAFKSGGLVALDEIDLCDASVLAACNTMDNDEFTFGNGERIERHRDFYLVAFANTIGTGSTRGFTRNVLDAATRDRYTVVELEYDMELERKLYGNVEWAVYCQRVREHVVKTMNSSFYVTSRAIRKGAAYLAKGMNAERVADAVLFKGLSRDVKATIVASVGKFIED